MKVELKVPKKYEKFFGCLETDIGLTDDCKYMLYFADGYGMDGEYQSVPCFSKKEALRFLRAAAPLKY